MTIILASSSPRRKELMEMLFSKKNLLICPAKGEEKPPENASPGETVKTLALAKAREVAENRELQEDEVIVAADTIVWHQGRIYGKPHSEEEAYHMLRNLSSSTHEVYTGLAVITRELEQIEYERTAVSFRAIDEEEIFAYIASKEPMDKAGAYGAQGRAALFVKRIDGDFFNVIGLPLCRLGEMLKKTGVKLF